MAIKIEITDPHLTDPNTLRKLAAFLLSSIGDQLEMAAPVKPVEPIEPVKKSRKQKIEIVSPPLSSPPPPPPSFHMTKETPLIEEEVVIVPPPQLPKETFGEFIDKITVLVEQGKLDTPRILQAVKSVGLSTIPQIGENPDLIPQIWDRINNSMRGA